MADTDPQGDTGREEGFLRACEGILRTRFGRRSFSAATRALQELARQERKRTLGRRWSIFWPWREALALARRRWLVPAGVGVALVAGALAFLWSGRAPQRVKIGSFAAVMGTPSVQRLGDPRPDHVVPRTPVYLGDRIETGDADQATVRFQDGTTLRLSFNTRLEIPVPPAGVGSAQAPLTRPPAVKLFLGQVWSKVQKTPHHSRFAVHTPVATAIVRGTEFRLKVQRVRLDLELGPPATTPGRSHAPSRAALAKASTSGVPRLRKSLQAPGPTRLEAVLAVKEGAVEFFNALGKVEATAMTESIAQAGSAPTEPRRLASLKLAREGQTTAVVIETQRPTLPGAEGRLVFPVGWAGLEVRNAPPDKPPVAGAQSVSNLPVRVVRVWPASPASRAGIQVGDVIVARDGQPVRNAAAIATGIATQSHHRFSLTLSRDASPTPDRFTVSLTTGPRPDAPPAPALPAPAAARLEAATRLLIQGQIAAAQAALERLTNGDTAAAALNNLGLLCETKDRPGEAISRYQAATRLDPTVALYHFNLGMALHNIGNPERSTEEFETARLLAPRWAEPLQELGDLYSLLDRPADALRAADTALKLYPNSPDFWIDKANLLRKQHHLDQARDAVGKALKIEPTSAAAYQQLGQIELDRGNLAAAETALGKSAVLDPTDAETFGLLGEVLQDLGRLDDAVPVLQRAIALSPTHGNHYSNLGYLYVRRGQPAEAEKLYRQAIAVEPDNAVPYTNLGELYRKLGRLAEAEQMLRKAIALAPNNTTALNNLGGLYQYNRRQPAQAEKIYREAIQLDAGYFAPYFNLAWLYYGQGRIEEAEKAFRKVIELYPTFAPAYNGLGLLLAQARRQPDAAKRMFRKAIELNPGFSPAYSNLGHLYADRAQPDQAERMFRQALDLDPKNTAAREGLIRLLALTGRKLDQALALAVAAVNEHPQNAGYLDLLGLVHLKRGELPEAETALRQAIEQFGASTNAAGAWFHLGNVEEQRTQKTAAADAYRTALRLQPNHADAKTALERLEKGL